MSKSPKNNIKIDNPTINKKLCVQCNPQKYLKFSLAYISYESGEAKNQDVSKLWQRMRWLSREPYQNMIYEHGKDKKLWFETLPLTEISKEVPKEFREIFPSITNEKYSVMRVYPSGTPNGTANPRIIGIIRNTIFYIFYLDWDGKLYNH